MKKRKRKKKCSQKMKEQIVNQIIEENPDVTADIDHFEVSGVYDFDNSSDITGLADIEAVVDILNNSIKEREEGQEIREIVYDDYLKTRFKELGIKGDYQDITWLRDRLQARLDHANRAIKEL